MKKIYLFRHSSPDKNSTLQNEYIPLSPEGKDFAKQFVDKLPLTTPIKVSSSPFIRAKQYTDINTKNDNGESFRMVQYRVSEFMNDLLKKWTMESLLLSHLMQRQFVHSCNSIVKFRSLMLIPINGTLFSVIKQFLTEQ